MFSCFCVFLLINLAFCGIKAADDPIVQLPKGKIRGHILKSGNGNSFYAFQEIPYAAPPVGNNRFQLAKEPQPWSGIRNTTKNTVVCYQRSSQYQDLAVSEDCLYINVYTPVEPGSSNRLPVLFWIHGGALMSQTGAYQKFGTKYIMDQGIVVVTMNYRLGSFGFLTTEDEVIPPNLGLKDQYFALEWVQENIELFGGNKSMVTIGGQSAGSVSSGLHLMGPWYNDKVLFHAAIMQSGTEIFFSRSSTNREDAFKAGSALDKTFNSTDSKELLKVLQQASAQDILRVAKSKEMVEKSGLFECPVYECLSNGNFKNVPLLIGFTSEERLYLAQQRNVAENAAALDKDPLLMLGSQFNLSSTNRTTAANLLRRIYTKTSFADNIGAYIRWNSDSVMTTPLTKHAELHAKRGDVYLYKFSHKGPMGRMMNLPDVPGTEKVATPEMLHYMWDDGQNSDLSKYPEEDKLTMQRYVKLWTNFVKYHNPTPEKDALLQNIIWPKIDRNQPDNIQYLNMNDTLEVLSNPRYYQQVKKVMDYYITPDIII